MSTLFVEQLTTIDFSYLCPQRGLTGETWLVDVALSGELNEEGMVFDFGHVKKEIKAMIDAYADHALLVPSENSNISVTIQDGIREVHLQQEGGLRTRCLAPAQAILPLPVDHITPELVRPLLEQHILKGLPENVSTIELALYPQDIQGAYYHYSHGLKKHSGDCQRIAHGHRSQIKIYRDGERQELIEQQIALEWSDIYLATRKDLRSEETLSGQHHYTFAYEAAQGHFELQIPKKQCYLMDTDTTVELIANHLAIRLSEEHDGRLVKVIANEGFCKGAIGVSHSKS